jgi:hypothetical protein
MEYAVEGVATTHSSPLPAHAASTQAAASSRSIYCVADHRCRLADHIFLNIRFCENGFLTFGSAKGRFFTHERESGLICHIGSVNGKSMANIL